MYQFDGCHVPTCGYKTLSSGDGGKLCGKSGEGLCINAQHKAGGCKTVFASAQLSGDRGTPQGTVDACMCKAFPDTVCPTLEVLCCLLFLFLPGEG